MEWPGLPRSRLRAVSPSVFYWDVTPDEFEFVLEGPGAASLRYRGAGVELRLEQTSGSPGA